MSERSCFLNLSSFIYKAVTKSMQLKGCPSIQKHAGIGSPSDTGICLTQKKNYKNINYCRYTKKAGNCVHSTISRKNSWLKHMLFVPEIWSKTDFHPPNLKVKISSFKILKGISFIILSICH